MESSFQEGPLKKKPIRDKYQELFDEHKGLLQMKDAYQKQLSELKSKHNTDESWVFVDT